MIRVAVIAALIFSPRLAAGAPKKAHERRFEFQVPEIPVPEIPDIEIPAFDFEFPEMIARVDRDEDDEDQDHEEDQDQPERDEHGARVYKMNRQQGIHIPRVHVGPSEDDEWDERDATAQARGRNAATLPVRGPITFQLRAQSGDIEIASSERSQVSVTVTESPDQEVALYAFGDRVEPTFRGRRTLHRGKVRIELPRGSRVDLSSMSGDVSVRDTREVRIRTMSGDVKLASVGKADVQTISGDVRIDDAAGPVRLHTVSGHGVVNTGSSAPQIEFQSASGNMDWTGVCARDCHLSAETVSGELHFAVDPKSSFELSYTSHSGELRDEVNLSVKRAPRRKHGMASGWLEATFGKGEGVIEADAFSGNLTVKKK